MEVFKKKAIPQRMAKRQGMFLRPGKETPVFKPPNLMFPKPMRRLKEKFHFKHLKNILMLLGKKQRRNLPIKPLRVHLKNTK